jgi:hypothetical protein
MMNENLLASQEGFCCMELETMGRPVFTDVTYRKYLGGEARFKPVYLAGI